MEEAEAQKLAEERIMKEEAEMGMLRDRDKVINVVSLHTHIY